MEENKTADQHIIKAELIRLQQRDLEPDRHRRLFNQRLERHPKNVRLRKIPTETEIRLRHEFNGIEND